MHFRGNRLFYIFMRDCICMLLIKWIDVLIHFSLVIRLDWTNLGDNQS